MFVSMFRIIIVISLFTLSSCSTDLYQAFSFGEKIKYLDDGTRLTLVSNNGSENLIIFPGGPGTDSSYLKDFANRLEFPGKVWLIDLPNNGSNLVDSVVDDDWNKSAIEVTKYFGNPVVMGHSFGAALILENKQIDDQAKALILMSVPYKNMEKYIKAQQKKYKLPDIVKPYREFYNDPTEENIARIGELSIPYHFLPSHYPQGIELYKNTPTNIEVVLRHRTYWEQYSPLYVPEKETLIIGGDFDPVSPIENYKKDKSYKKGNITFREIKSAGHYPFVEAMDATVIAVNKFLELIYKRD